MLFRSILAPSSSSVTVITTILVTTTSLTTVSEPPVTTTYTASPTTIVDVFTIGASPSVSRTAWVAPAQMTDLSAFDISHLADGANNLKLLAGLPANASTDSTALVAEALPTPGLSPGGSSPATWDNSSILQVFYPADSVNPSSNPLGGAEFYAAPLNLSNADRKSVV